MSHISITPSGKTIRVLWKGHVLATSDHALDLKEGGAPVVRYIPRADADMRLFSATERKTRCPYKGEASYFSLQDGAEHADNAVWSYETPIVDAAAIAGHLAFYPNVVTFEEG